jgi:hypothetical protein
MDHHHEPDLEAIADRLRRERPELTPLELDGLQQRIRSTRATPRRTTFMKSRLAVTMMLMLGLVLSSAGAGLAVSGQSGSSNAAGEQYKEKTAPAPNSAAQDVLGEVGTVNDAPSRNSAPTVDEAQPSQPVEQAEVTGDGELPFTGFAAGGILVLGLGLLGGGLVLRRRLGDER